MKVRKRDGRVVEFDASKIRSAVEKAFESVDGNVSDAAREKAAEIAASIEAHGKDLSVEEIQDAVEKKLMASNRKDVAKEYILYRKQREKARNVEQSLLSYKDVVDNYLKVDDWRVKENSTVTYSIGGLILSNSGAITANYWLNEVYDKEIAEAHRKCDIHIHDLSMLAGYCAGWSLKQLIQEGLGGVPGKIASTPASHLSTLCNQMVNFLGIMQNEWSGAQAFSSFDTYLAPFVKVDNLTQKQVKQCIQSFVFGVNTPSRWGCVDAETEVLTIDGFKTYDKLQKGDKIYTWNNGTLELNAVKEIVVKQHDGIMHGYRGRGYHQYVTPDHRVLCKKHNKNEYVIRHSSEIFDAKTPYSFPARFTGSSLQSSKLSMDEIQMAAIIYCDGSIDMRGDSVHKVSIFKSPQRTGNELIEELANSLELEYRKREITSGFDSVVNQYVFYGDSARTLLALVGQKDRIADRFLTMDSLESNVFLQTWAAFDGREEKFMLQYDNDVIRDQLQHIAVRAGYTSYLESMRANYVKIRGVNNVTPSERYEEEYRGIVWCPNVDNGTAVFRKDGTVFISGQCQAPFSNITLDWTVPKDMENLPAIVGGKEMDFTYGDCKKEMDMVNKAFLEVMIEGDANGRGFQYPIPTYSITRDFDWSDTENNRLLFEMTAKYGTPYFSNYINSDMEPSDVRSMAVLGTQNVIYRDKFGRISKNEIRHLVNNWIDKPDRGYQMLMNGKFVDIIDMFKVDYKNYPTYVKINLANGQSQSFSYDHKCIVLRNGVKAEVLSQDVLSTDKFLLAKHGYDNNGIGTYATGKIIGYYLAEGWAAHNDAQVEFAVNINRKDIASEIKSFFESLGAYVSVDEQTENNIFRIKAYGRGAVAFMSDFIEGKSAKEKKLRTTVFNTSLDFRKGIYDGYMQTDGSPENGIFAHTTNKELCEDLIELGASIGRYFRYRVNPNNTRYFKPDKSDLVTFTSYKLMPVNLPEVTIDGEDYYVVDVTGIEQLSATHINTVYNFTVDTNDHLYELPNGVITHQCCRLRLDLRELRRKSGGFFGSGESTGSIGVVTVNLPRLAYKSETEEDFYAGLDKLMDIAARSLDVKRKYITKLLDAGLYPYTKRYLGTFRNHFSTIGLVGMNEATLNAKWLGVDLTHEAAQQFAKDVLNHMRERLSDYQEQYGDLYNLEATPAESTTYRFAKHDKEEFPDIITANMNGTPYYTNSSHLPVGYTEDVFSALDVQDELQTLYTSGTVFHAFLGEKLPDWKAAAELVRKIAENYKLPYYTMSPTYSVCKDHGYLTGEQFKCPICGQPTEVYSRITGYYRPVQNWNDGKVQEYKDRREYKISFAHSEMFESPIEDVAEANEPEKVTDAQEALLFTTPTCPNCKMAKAFMDRAGFEYTPLNAIENTELVQEYGIKQAPTLVIKYDNNVEKYRGVSEIKGFLNARSKAQEV